MEVLNVLETKAYELSEEEIVPVIKNWLGWKDLQLITLSPKKKYRNTRVRKSFLKLCSKFILQQNRTVISL